MAADPHADQRQQRRTEVAAALAAMYVAARGDVLRNVRNGLVRGALPSRWQGRLREIVAAESRATARVVGRRAVALLGGDVAGFDASRMEAYLDVFAAAFSEAWQAETERMLDAIDLAAADLEAEARRVMDSVVEAADNDAEAVVQRPANLAVLEAGKASGATTKTWVTGTDPRASHAALNGVTVPIDGRFPNGLRFPGSPGPPAEVVNCNCRLTVA